MPKTHPDEKTLEKFGRGKLSRRENLKVSWHLYNCGACRQELEKLAPEGGDLLETLFEGLKPQDIAHSPSYDRAFAYGQGTLEVRGEARDRDKSRAPKLYAELMRHPVSRQQALIERTWRFKNYVFAEYLLEQSYQYLAQDPARAEDLARLALVIAEKLEGSHYGPALIHDLKARAFAYLGNAQRVSMDLDEADQSLTQAEKNLQDGSGDPLLQARLLSFMGSLRREQRRFDEAEECLEKAESIYREAGESHWLGHTLVKHAKLHYDAGDMGKAIGLYEKALDLIDRKADPRLEFCLLMGLAGAHQEQSDFDQASKLLAKANKLAEAQSNPLDALRLRWIQGKVAYGQDELEQAESSFDAVRSGFIDRDLDYEAALVSLDTAQVYAQQGRTAEMKQLAEAMLPIFRSRNIHREATAALLVFQKAALAEKASLKMVREIASYLREARDNPQLRYKQAS